MESSARSSFTSRIGFVLAAAGSAVGLGNIWRFPYLAAKYGGGIFLLVYIILAVTFGFTLMTAEIAIGRKTGLSAVGAYRALDKRFGFVGILSSLVPMIILPYYTVISGWVAKYLFTYLTGGGQQAAADGYFSAFIRSTWSPIFWFLLCLLATFAVVMMGVEKGIEKCSKILMPFLVILSVIIAIFSITRPGAWEGVLYYILPDPSRFSVMTVVAAMGQMFYSMSLAMGIMITYGSYMKKDTDLAHCVGQIEIFDTGIAFLAGLIIIPAVFAYSGGDADALNAGAGLMFITIPKVFASMNMGGIIGAIFFLLVLFAAITSTISLMEAIVSIFLDQFHISRPQACMAVLVICLALGIPSSLGHGPWSAITFLGKNILDSLDFISNSVMMPVAAFCTCIFVSKGIGVDSILSEVKHSSHFHREKLFIVMIRYIAPIFIIAVLVSSVLDALGLLVI
ncbi:sodium-dependent transporter [Angelakisella massiliensis]|uniref:sodium-dependent transporter n=1 Tax=Angelakisella massiliensis TaxID=1871018 RepID=UPI0008F87200|nr:sodium-dependent transporter [Angelakisella massiliensis]